MWQDKLKEVIYILENSNVNEIDVTFWGRRFRAVKSVGVNLNSDSKLNQTSPVVSMKNLYLVNQKSQKILKKIIVKKFYHQCQELFILHLHRRLHHS